MTSVTVSEAQIYHSMVNDCAAPLISEDMDGKIITFNKAAEQMFGYVASELIGAPMTELIPEERAHEQSQVQAMLSQNQPVCDLTTVRVHKDGHLMVVTLTASPIFDGLRNRVGTCHVLRRSVTNTMVEKDLLYLAFRDPLTGLYNRTHFLDRLNYIMRRDERTQRHAGILFIDLDNFKNVNDSAGHLVGDKLLKQCARRLQSNVREHDTIARWGGDEFVVLVDNLSPSRARTMEILEQIAQNVLSALSKPYYIDSEQFNCSATIGVSLFRGFSHPIESVISQADKAMYKAKLSGKNAICVHRKKDDERLRLVSNGVMMARG
ncbi:MAG TPA: sensor domain-containing diguanylate cyclase [Steroidobacteraceae bacterium]|jgi:diguanylate cyclase (GGDEF)-like protein/PAS domain S-box-containing protein|nr:sensor domain-containing diguanylate cyclase [Steroidobacteraceae bacterium]